MGAKIIMIKLNSNIINISLLKCVLDELDKEKNMITCNDCHIFDVKETIKEVIESLQNKG